MITPEKNDVNISKLFQWGKEFPITDEYGNELLHCHIRLVGDAELNRARVFALRKSAELRKKLKTEGTDERVGFIADQDTLDKENIIQFLLILKTKEVSVDIIKDTKVPFPKEPDSDASLEEQEKYQLAVDEYPEKRREIIQAEIEKHIAKEKESLDHMDMDSLYKMYVNYTINDLCEMEMYKYFKQMCVYFGTYKDPEFKEHLFSTYEEFENLQTFLKDQFIDNYSDLEMNMDGLKKLLGATPS